MTDIQNQNRASDQDNRSSSAQSAAVQNYDPSVHLPAQAAGAQVDPFASGQQPKGKRRGKKSNKGQQEAAFANSQDQSTDGQGAEKASGGGGGGNTPLYVAGGLGLVGAGLALAGGGGSSATETPKDTTPPTAPTVALATDTGSSSSDRITSNGRIDVGGLETGATWEYSTNGGTSWQAGSGTSFTLTSGSYADGAVLVRQKDAAGNVSANGKPAGAVTVDATAPSVAVIAQVAGDGTVSAAEKEAGITVTGTGEAGSNVSVVWGTVTKTTTVGSSNSWSVQFASADVPADGATTVRVTLTDPAGNASAAAERAVTVDTKIAIQGSIVAGPLVAGHGLTVSLYTSDGKLLQSDIAVANDGSFSARVAAKKGDVLIAKVTDSGAGADYADESSGASKDLNAALFATVIVADLSTPVQAQINPVTTLAAIKAGLSADGSGTVKDAAAVRDANALVAKALGLDDVNVAPVATNSGTFSSADGLSAAEKLGAVLAALSGLDGANGGDSQKTLTSLSSQIGGSGAALSAAGQADLLTGAAAASLRADGKLESTISDLLAKSQQFAEVSIDAVATDNVLSSTEVGSLTLTGTVAAGATSVVVALGSATGTATIDGTKWTYSVTSSDVAALGSDGAIILSVTANFEGGVSKTAARPILLDTQGPEAPKVNAVAGDNYVNAAEAGKVTLSGTAEAGSKVVLKWGSTEVSVNAGLDGNWTADVAGAAVPTDGSTVLKVYAVDANGNIGTELAVPVTIDRARPNKPLIDAVSQDDRISSVEAAKTITLTGTAEAGSKIFLSWGGTKELSETVIEGGSWSVKVLAADIPKAGVSQITAYVVDPAGNRSEVASRDVTIYGALTKPVIFPVAADNMVNAAESLGDVSVNGLAPSNALVRLTWGTTSQTVKADENGDWSAKFGLTDLPVDGPSTILAVLVDEFDAPLGANQNAELAVMIDTIAPESVVLAPIATDNVVNAKEKSDGFTVSGTAEAGSKITLTWGATSRTETVKDDRSWTINLQSGEVPLDGTIPLKVISTDAAGNVSQETSRDIRVDTQAPDAPLFSLKNDTGSSNKDNITNDGTLVVSGVEANATWSYSLNSGDTWQIGGSDAVTELALGRADFEVGQILVRQTDSAGNVSAGFSNASKIVVDGRADPIIMDDITENPSTATLINASEKAAGVTISGSHEAYSTVVVTWNGVSKSAEPADEQGIWSVKFRSDEIPADGATTILVTATDVAGNVVTKSIAATVDTNAPDALTLALRADTNISTDNITKDSILNVSGFEANSSWQYSLDSGVTWVDGNVVRDSASSFDLFDGTYLAGQIRVRQIDAAGNIGAEKALAGNLVIDTIAQGLTINKVAEDDVVNLSERGARVTVTGRAEAGAAVAVTLAGVTTPVTADGNGVWRVNYDALASFADGEYELSVVQTDVAGNVSEAVTQKFTIDTQRPATPTLDNVAGDNKINAADITAGITLSGKAAAYGKVQLDWGTGVVTLDVDKNGDWSTPWDAAKLPEDGSRTLSVTAINTVGNVSQAYQQVVTLDRVVAAPTVATIAGDGKVNASEKAQGITITGVAEGGATVALTWGSVTKSVQAASSGDWSVYFGPTEIAADGSATMSVIQTDVLGNVSTPRTLNPLVDSLLPSGATISAIANDDILVQSERSGLVTVSGSAEAYATVVVTWGGVTQEVSAGPNRSWTALFAGSALPATGDAVVTAQVRDGVGNLSEVSSRTVTFVQGEVTAPVIGIISTDNALNATEKAAGVRLSGLAGANEALVVQIGTVSKPVAAGSGGAWSISFSAAELPADGTYSVTATSARGTTSRQLLVDTSAPAPAIIASVATDGVVDGLEKAQGITITGTAEAGAQVSILWAGLRKAATLSGTTWSASFAPDEIAGDSSSVAQVTVRDAAGNQSTASTNITVASTPHLAIAKAGVIAATAEMFGLSDTATSASTVSISVSGLSNGAFSKSGVAASAFTLQDVKDGLVLFTHNGSDAAPAYSVAISSAGVTTAAKAAFVAFATGGTDGADTLSGTSAADLLIGMGGDDLIMGGAGNDILYGHGTGATGLASDNDVFKWAAGDAGTGALDVIRDFDVWNGTSGDKLDIAGLLQGFTGSGQSLDKWVTVQDNVTPSNLLGWDATRSGALITIDLDGPGSGTVTQSIFLEGVSLGSGSVNTLVSTGVIIA